jgi:hypothetical protein
MLVAGATVADYIAIKAYNDNLAAWQKAVTSAIRTRRGGW